MEDITLVLKAALHILIGILIGIPLLFIFFLCYLLAKLPKLLYNIKEGIKLIGRQLIVFLMSSLVAVISILPLAGLVTIGYLLWQLIS